MTSASLGQAQVDAVHRAMLASAHGSIRSAAACSAGNYATAPRGASTSDDFAVHVQLATAAEDLSAQLAPGGVLRVASGESIT